MPPRRSIRRNSGSAIASFKKGDPVEFTINGSTVKGKIVRKSTKGSSVSPHWIVAPSGRRRSEEVPEKDILILNENETAPTKSKRLARSSTGGTTSSYSEDSSEDGPSARRSTRGSATATGSSEEQSESSKKRKSADSDTSSNRKSRKVTFSEGKRATFATVKKKRVAKKKPAGRAGNISTRSTRANGGELLSELPPASKPIKSNLAPKPKRDENIKVIKMLTGTLYLYRGETRRAEFVRSKY